MQTFKNKNYTKRNYECTNVIACVADAAPGDNWIPCGDFVLAGLTSLHVQNGVRYYGYL